VVAPTAAASLQAAWLDLERQRAALSKQESALYARQSAYDAETLESDMKKRPLTDCKRFIFQQDHQGYELTRLLFATNAPLTAKQMSQLTWQHPGAGRVSVSLGVLLNQLEAKGFKAHLIGTMKRDEHLNSPYETVVGATGNY
jgi:hypothetical protein